MKAGTVLKLARPHYIESHAPRLRQGIEETLAALVSTADTFNAELASTAADQNLSPRGRAAGARKVAAAALAKLAFVESTTIKNLNDHAKHLEGQLLGRATFVPPKDPAERIAHEMQMQEIRGQLRQLPAVQRLSVYLSSSDPLVLAAIETAPMTLSERRPDGSRRLEPFIDPAQRTAAALARAEREDAATAEQLKDVHSVREVYVLAVNSLRKEILDEVPGAGETKPTVRVG